MPGIGKMVVCVYVAEGRVLSTGFIWRQMTGKTEKGGDSYRGPGKEKGG
jgi:hypothetical protein